MSRALVLGGGGVIGIAWEIGILRGLHRAGMTLGDADTIIGTSAGSLVGTVLAAGADLEMAAAQQQKDAPARARFAEETADSGAEHSLLVEPDEAALHDLGQDIMDTSRRPASVRAGLRQGQAIAEDVRTVWLR